MKKTILFSIIVFTLILTGCIQQSPNKKQVLTPPSSQQNPNGPNKNYVAEIDNCLLNAVGKKSSKGINISPEPFLPPLNAESALKCLGKLPEGKKYYALAQFNGIPSQVNKDLMASMGMEMHGYISNNAWFISFSRPVDNLPFLHSLTRIQPINKVYPQLWEGGASKYAIEEDYYIIDARFFEQLTDVEVSAIISEYGGKYISGSGNFHRLKVPMKQLKNFAGENNIQYITEESPPIQDDTNKGSCHPDNRDPYVADNFSKICTDTGGTWHPPCVDMAYMPNRICNTCVCTKNNECDSREGCK